MILKSTHPSIFPLLPPISSLSWFASISLLDGWGYGFSFSSLSYFFFLNCNDVSLLWHVLKLCMQSVILSCLFLCPWLSITVLYFVKRGRGKKKKRHNLPSAGSQGWISNSLFFTFYHTHWATCRCVSQCCHILLKCRMLSQEGGEVTSQSLCHAVNL